MVLGGVSEFWAPQLEGCNTPAATTTHSNLETYTRCTHHGGIDIYITLAAINWKSEQRCDDSGLHNKHCKGQDDDDGESDEYKYDNAHDDASSLESVFVFWG